jgi:hypothetical protein
MMEDDPRIYTSYLNDALTDKDVEDKKVKAKLDAELAQK